MPFLYPNGSAPTPAPMPRSANAIAPLPYLDRFDKVEIYVDSEPGKKLFKRVQDSCGGGATCQPVYIEFQLLWRHELTLLQPTSETWPLLQVALGSGINAQVHYVEVARDIIFATKKQARRAERLFWALVYLHYGRSSDSGSFDKKGRRLKAVYLYARNKGPKNLVTYATRKSKPSHPYQGLPCLHIEIRLNESASVQDSGLVTCADFEAFNFEAFWADTLRFVRLPKTKESVGKKLKRLRSKAGSHGLRKRVDMMVKDDAYRINLRFSMHQSLCKIKGLKSKLKTMAFNDWMKICESEKAIKRVNKVLGAVI